ncbi:MAG: VOC family protein [Gammaproteobacteria bacterium]|nr:VOC family protein [Gammaproteobacteria bacterium]
MLTIEHLNLVVKDIDATLAFYQALAPHWRVRTKGRSDWHGTLRNWVHFGDDYQFLTFNDSGTGENRVLQGNTLGLTHFALSTNNLAATVTRLINAGFAPRTELNVEAHRQNIYFIDPNGYEVELVQYFSDIPAERNLTT